jgi:hypothetical protein
MKRVVMHSLTALLLVLGCAGTAHATGRAEVSFGPSERFTDAGFGPREIERTQRVLTKHLERLAQKLPDGQVLKVQVHDIDLAGEPDTHVPDRVRVLGRAADSPRLDLRFELLASGGDVLKQGDVVLTDLAYLDHGVGIRRGEPLEYERRLLDEWFRDSVAPDVKASH